jgi:hypothetical protein
MLSPGSIVPENLDSENTSRPTTGISQPWLVEMCLTIALLETNGSLNEA